MKFRSAQLTDSYCCKPDVKPPPIPSEVAASIIIPAGGLHILPRLRRCLESIKAPEGVEILLVYLAKNVSEIEEVNKLSDLVSRIVFGRLTSDHFPLARARNAGGLHAKNDLLIFVDADMLLDPLALPFTLSLPQAVTTVWARYMREDEDLEKLPEQFVERVKRTESGVVGTRGFGGYLSVPRAQFLELGGYDEGYDLGWGAEDNDFLDRLVDWGRVPYHNLSVEHGLLHAHQWHPSVDHSKDRGTLANRQRYLYETCLRRNPRGFGQLDELKAPPPKGVKPKPPNPNALHINGCELSVSSKPVVKKTDLPSTFLISDVRGWAFDQNMQDLEEYLSDRFEITHGYVAEWTESYPQMGGYDIVYALYYKWGIDRVLPWKKTLGALRARWMFSDHREKPRPKEFAVANSYAAFQVSSLEAFNEMKVGCPRAVYLTNPVNMRRFPSVTPVEGEVIASWNGNAAHVTSLGEKVKGFEEFIIPACESAEVPLVYAEYNTCKLLPAEMPSFYQKSNVALCASMYEGCSNSSLEAMASGLALIATDVGNVRDMYESQISEYGESGIIIVPRKVEAFVEELKKLKADPKKVTAMGRINRAEIERAWSWSVWADRYADFLRIPLR